MKKLILILSTIMVLISNTLSFATEEIVHSNEIVIEENVTKDANDGNMAGNAISENNSKSENVTPSTKKILSNMSKKERKIAEYTDKYNDKAFAYTAYYLEIAQTYSIPFCIIGLTIGAFNFYIIGEKKLDKREQGFGFIVAFLCALVLFQVLPLIFALFVAGR